MKRKFKILYTHQKTKKKKVWQDGTLTLSIDNCRGFLYDDSKKEISTIYLNKKKVEDGVELENDKYLIQVEEEIAASSDNFLQNSQIVSSGAEQLAEAVESTTSKSCSITAMSAKVKTKFSVPRKAQPVSAQPTEAGGVQSPFTPSFSKEASKTFGRSSIWSSVIDDELQPSQIIPVVNHALPPLASSIPSVAPSVNRDTSQLLQLLGESQSADVISAPPPTKRRKSADIELDFPSFLHSQDSEKELPERRSELKFEVSTPTQLNEEGVIPDYESFPADDDIVRCLERLIESVVENVNLELEHDPKLSLILEGKTEELSNDHSPQLSDSKQDCKESLLNSEKPKELQDKKKSLESAVANVTENDVTMKENKSESCSCEQIYTCADKVKSRSRLVGSMFDSSRVYGVKGNCVNEHTSSDVLIENDLSRYDLFSSKSICLDKNHHPLSHAQTDLVATDHPKFISLLADSDSLDDCVPDFDFGFTQLQASSELGLSQGDGYGSPVVMTKQDDLERHKPDSKFYSSSDYDEKLLFDLFDISEDILLKDEEKNITKSERKESVSDDKNCVSESQPELRTQEDLNEKKAVNSSYDKDCEDTKSDRPQLLDEKIEAKMCENRSSTCSVSVSQKEDVLKPSGNHVTDCDVTCDEADSFSYSPLRSTQLSPSYQSVSSTSTAMQLGHTNGKRWPNSDQLVPNLFEDFSNICDEEAILLEACMEFEDISTLKSEKKFTSETMPEQKRKNVRSNKTQPNPNSVLSNPSEIDQRQKVFKVEEKLLKFAAGADSESLLFKTEKQVQRNSDTDLHVKHKLQNKEKMTDAGFECRPSNQQLVVSDASYIKSKCAVEDIQSKSVLNETNSQLSFRRNSLCDTINDESCFVAPSVGWKKNARELSALSDRDSISRIGGVFSQQAVTMNRWNQTSRWGNAETPLVPAVTSRNELFSTPLLNNKWSKFMERPQNDDFDLMSSRLVTSNSSSRFFKAEPPTPPSRTTSPFHQVPKPPNMLQIRNDGYFPPISDEYSHYDITATQFAQPSNSKRSDLSQAWLRSTNREFDSQQKQNTSKWSRFESDDCFMANSKKQRRQWLEQMVAREKSTPRPRRCFPEVDILKTPQLNGHHNQSGRQCLWSSFNAH